ncbi:HotDog domain-containing protein [Melampsora americana]|nr:HotDog domain-containing protein [Melampsora americana]
MAASTKFVNQVWKAFLSNNGHDATCLSKLKILSANPNGLVHARLQITHQNLNRLGSVHGGLISSIVDTCGSLSLSAKGLWMTGVSTDIHVSYLRPAGKDGSSIDIEAKVESMGKTLAYTSILLRDPVTGKLLARGSHTKFIAPSVGHAMNVKFDETGETIVEGKMPDDVDIKS